MKVVTIKRKSRPIGTALKKKKVLSLEAQTFVFLFELGDATTGIH